MATVKFRDCTTVLAVTATILWSPLGSDSKDVTVSNVQPKLDIHGNIVNAHDGTYRYFEGYYWYHGAEYGLCNEPAKRGCDQTPGRDGPPYPAPGHCGFQADHNVSIYRSKDLTSGSWEFMGRAVHCATDVPNCGILYRPHLVHNPNTNLYVLFVNFVSKTHSYGGNAVFTAPTPAGPFTLKNKQMNLSRLCPGPAIPDGQPCGAAQGGCGDYDVLVDPRDGAAYIIYGCNFWMSIERLTDDYYNSAGENASIMNGAFNGNVFPEYFTEAPAFFIRNNIFYALFGHCCCFCFQGSGIMVYTAHNPMGPWTAQCSDVVNNTGCLSPSGDLACIESNDAVFSPHAEPTPNQGCNYKGRSQVSALRAQQNFVITIERAGGDNEYLWTGDRWQQAPDGIKGHEGQTWALLDFDSMGRITPVRWHDNVTFHV
eukprot:m.215447 g.215447  ORF g.215447 m.215447 type:complete len:427 (+) comp19097_c0_seq3:50-1330(+)